MRGQGLMPAVLEYVPMTHDDIPWVARTEADCQSYPWTAGNFADSLRAGNSCWLQRYQGQPSGFGIMLLVVDEAHLLNLAIAPARRLGGLGRSLLLFLCAEANRAGALQMFLEVRPTNQPARTLYARYGFEEVGRRRNYYPAAGGREDALVLRRAL